MILAIESTAHTFGIGIVKDKKVLANIIDSYKAEKGGIVPIEAAKHHEKIKEKVLEEALNRARVKIEDIKAIAFSQGPGLPPCLLVGLRFVKGLAKKYSFPLVPVNHCLAHLDIGQLTGAKNPVLLYVSGANTQIISYASRRYRIFGETLDMGVGNFIDAFARYVGIGFPGGPKIAELAKKCKAKDYIELPYSIKGMDVSFSGMLTNLKQKFDAGEKIENLAYSLQETSFAMLIEASERAMAHLKKNELLLGGGVACNKRLQEMSKIMCKERKAKFFCPPPELLIDNAAMIAFLGEKMFKAGIKILGKAIDKLDIKPYQRTDDVKVRWKK